MNTEKICRKCRTLKSLGEFAICRKNNDGHSHWCKECHKQYNKTRYRKNTKQLLQQGKEWRKNNIDKIKDYYNNPDVKLQRRLYKREWDRERLKDPMFRLSNNIRGGMYHALRGKKGFKKWEDLVGYTLEDLIKHIEPLFVGEMSWTNYGTIWQVDHVVPKSWFKYESTDDPKFKECWALKNLQPKLKVDNIQKGNRYVG